MSNRIRIILYPCPICNKTVFLNSEWKKSVGYVYQGKVRRYFHLACLESIKRGSYHG